MSRESIRGRVAAAWPGPWHRQSSDDPAPFFVMASPGSYVVADVFVEPDAAFIAHARQDIPALLAVADAAREMLDDSVHCVPTSGGTEGIWCVYHDSPMLLSDGDCEAAALWRAALDALEALP